MRMTDSLSKASMIVDDLDAMGVTVMPNEADTPTIVDPDAVLSSTIAFQPLQSIARRRFQILQADGSVQHIELPNRDLRDRSKGRHGNPREEPFRSAILEALDHVEKAPTSTTLTLDVKRPALKSQSAR